MTHLMCLFILTLICPSVAICQQRCFVSLPRAEPVFDGETGLASVPLSNRIAALVHGLGHAKFGERKRNGNLLAEVLVHEGKRAYDILNSDQYRQHDDPEIRLSVEDILSTAKQDVIPSVDADEVDGLLANGLNLDVLNKLNTGGKPVAAQMIRSHLQMKIGVDVLYSLKPGNVLPEACRLLALQNEAYYKVLLAKIMEAVLARAIKPVHQEQTLDTGGITYFRNHQDSANAIAALTTDPCDELRLTALRICAYGLIPLPGARVQRLLNDENPDIADEAAQLQCVFIKEATDNQATAAHASWVRACVNALEQQKDRLAQLGAYNALMCLIDRRTDVLYSFYLSSEGLARDALGSILSAGVVGRLLMVRDGRDQEIRRCAPASLNGILQLWDYDVKLKGLDALIKTDRDAVAPLLRRNLFVLGRSEQRWFTRVTWSKQAWAAAVRLGMRDLAPVLEKQMSQQRNGSEFQPLLQALSDTEGEAFMPNPARDWYAFCASQLDAEPLDIRTGAVRSLLASGKAGAEALWSRHRKKNWGNEIFAVYLRSLLLFHPYTKFLVDDTDEGLKLAADIAQSGLAFSDHVESGWRHGSPRKIYNGGDLRIPVALWAYANNNDCNCMNPIGNYLAENLKSIHAPLILSWLDHNSRMSIFLIEVDARNARDAVLRRVQQRRRDWGYCYDHDLFNFIVVYELLEALPFLEHYVKTNSNWPYKGIRTMAGIEKERYCWTQPVKSGRVNPLVLPSCRELIRHCGKKHLVDKYWNIISKELNLSE